MCRNLKASEIEVRVQSIKSQGETCKGAILLLYKNARVDMDLMDEAFGKYGWQRTHSFKDGRLYCTVSVWDKEKGQWISREDVGTESNTEAEKGQASDSFKRACVNFGAGRELYTSPFIYVDSNCFNYYSTGNKDRKGNTVFQTSDDFSVSNIVIEDKVITGLEIKNDKTNNIVFTFGKCKGKNKAQNQAEKKEDKQIKAENKNEPKISPVEPQNETQMTYEDALNHVIEVTNLAGKTFKEIWNSEKEMIPIIYEQGSKKTKKAIDTIRAEIKRLKELKNEQGQANT